MHANSEDEVFDQSSIAESDITIESMMTTSSMSRCSEPSTDERRLEQRQKQIDFGKNTIGYDRYICLVPKQKRRKGDPVTPDRAVKCSKRCWDGLVRAWRRALHTYDPSSNIAGQENTVDTPHFPAAQHIPQKLQFAPVTPSSPSDTNKFISRLGESNY